MSSDSFQQLANDLIRSFTPTLKTPHRPYPLAKVDMIARYGMRTLTPAEKQIFPGLCFVIRMQKVRITKAPGVMPKSKDWVVWVAKTYPGSYLVKMPGGAPLLAPYNQMRWVDVGLDTPITTLENVKESEHQQQWQAVFKRNIQQYLSV